MLLLHLKPLFSYINHFLENNMYPSIKQFSYDTVSVLAVVGYSMFVASAVVLSPVYATPVVIYSATKTAYYAARFFHDQKHAPKILATDYKNKNHLFVHADLASLKAQVEVFKYKELRDEYWKYTCKVAKGLIPVIGFFWMALSKTPHTDLSIKGTWTDLNALKYHVKKLELANNKAIPK